MYISSSARSTLWLHWTARPIEQASVKSNTPRVFQAATPSADFNYSCPAIATNRRPVILRAPLMQVVYLQNVPIKGAYHQQTSINCGPTPTDACHDAYSFTSVRVSLTHNLSPSTQENLSPAFMLVSCFLFFKLEDGGNIFLWNASWLSTDYMALYPRR
jgi:hypothetical protein